MFLGKKENPKTDVKYLPYLEGVDFMLFGK